MNFILTTDTSCDVFRSELDAKNIPWVPLTFTIGGTTYEDTFSSDAEFVSFYEKVAGGAMPTTSQITPAQHEDFFKKVLAEKSNLASSKTIVHLTLSSGLSETYNAAVLAAKTVMEEIKDSEIFVVDTLSATQGHHLLLKEGIRLRDNGTSGCETADALNQYTKGIHHWFMVDDLHHLKRGGRVSGAAAAIGTLLKIKPVLTINDKGKLPVVKKPKGIQKAIAFFLEIIEEYKDGEIEEFLIVSANAAENAPLLKARLEEKYPTVPVTIGWIGPVIGAHTGNGVFGVVFKGKARSTAVAK
ncbi:MAG: DegV family protein [Firmicutes bacterium]|nr:DegV family protein [Bacillota bacterium]